jgi:hypothetical protein
VLATGAMTAACVTLLPFALLLDEQITVAALAGLALILLGVALGSGALRRSPRGETVEAAAR